MYVMCDRFYGFIPDKQEARKCEVLPGMYGVSLPPPSTRSFSDVDAGAWYAPYVFALAEAGVVNKAGLS